MKRLSLGIATLAIIFGLNGCNSIELTDELVESLPICLEEKDDHFIISKGTVGEVKKVFISIGGKEAFELYTNDEHSDLYVKVGGELTILDVEHQELDKKGACLKVTEVRVKENTDGINSKTITLVQGENDKINDAIVKITKSIFKF